MRGAIIGIVLAAFGIVEPARAQDPAGAEGWVVLSVDDYHALRLAAFPTPPDPAPPPVDATLTRVDYELRVNGDTVFGEARLTVDILADGWVAIGMPPGLMVRGARLDGRPTTLVDGTPPTVLVNRRGRAELALDVVLPIRSNGGTESMTLPSAGAAVSSVAFTVPRTGVDLTVDGGFIADRSELAAESHWRVYAVAGRPLSLSWKRRIDDQRTSMPMRARAQVVELVALGEETSQISASVRLDIVQGLARAIALATPEGVVVNHVSGATVADWRHERGQLVVSFLEPITSAAMVVSAEARLPREGAVAIPLLRVPLAERETGGVAVDVAGAGEIGDRHPGGLDPTDPASLGDFVAERESPSMVAFRYRPGKGDEARTLSLSVTRYTPQAVLVANVEEARYEALAGDDGKILVRARFAVRNNQRSFLAVRLPAGSTLWSAALAGRPVRPGISKDGSLLLPLQKSRAGGEPPLFAVEVVYLQRTSAWAERGDARLELPAVDLPVSRTGLKLHHSPRFDVEPQSGVFRPETDRGPWSVVLSADRSETTLASASAPQSRNEGQAAAQQLVDRIRKDMARTITGVVPVEVRIPEVGPAIFVAAELTPEARAPVLSLEYRRTHR